MSEASSLILAVGTLPPPYDGQAIAFESLAEALRKRGVLHKIFDISAENHQEARSPLRRALSYARQFPFFALNACRNRNATVYITIAQSRRGFFRDAVFLWISHFTRSRIVAHVHGGNYGDFYAAQPAWLRSAIRATLRRVDSIVVLSDRLRSMFDFLSTSKPEIYVVANGLPHAVPEAARAKTIPATNSVPIRLLYLSNLIESKGYFDVLEAIRILRIEHAVDITADFCGSFVENPSDDRRVRNARQARLLFDSFVNQHGLNEAIRFHGVVTGDKKQGLLQSAHFLVLPTNYDAEGQPISIIEAMAYGCVVIATAYRAIPDMVDPGVTGWLVPFESPHRIAEGVLACIENPDTFQSMSDAAITLVRRRFTQETHVERLLAILLQDANASGRSSTFAGNTTSSGDLAGHTAKAPLQHAD